MMMLFRSPSLSSSPSNAPIFFFKLIKKLDKEDKESLNKIYEELGNLEIEVVKI